MLSIGSIGGIRKAANRRFARNRRRLGFSNSLFQSSVWSNLAKLRLLDVVARMSHS
jgi:hypothetical protein